MALFATAVQFYAIGVQYQRDLEHAHLMGSPLVSPPVAPDSAALEVRSQAGTGNVVAGPTSQPLPDTPREALGVALSATVQVMREPRDGRMPSLERVAGPSFVGAFDREIEHLKRNDLRLSPRSGYAMLNVEQVAASPNTAAFVTQEQWLYEEENQAGRVVRCVLEFSTQRYQVERRGEAWIVTSLALADTPVRRGCES